MALIAGTLLAALLAASSSGIQSARASDAMEKVDAGVLDALAQGKGVATFWALMQEKANLTAAFGIQTATERGQFVVERLQATAEQSQAGLRTFLRASGAVFEPFWIANAIRITGDEALLRAVAARPEVARILASRTYEIPKPDPARLEAAIDAVEWNIHRINAPQVWSTFGVRGEGIIVASIDTGVQYDHSALVKQYRGNAGDGTFDHNYNWHDPSRICGSPSLVPCDTDGHGTHTMGTMVGDDGDPGPNQIGVAPHARWITAKGCESSSCSDFALLSSAQWILAPTDLSGMNPRPDLRPHVVNNSWGGPGDPWYMASVDAWIASGIFPTFSNGNSGSGCSTSSSPGDYPQSYSAGAFDINDKIADFSSRGASAFDGEIKPNIAAPGVSVRSSVPSGSYASFSGTSMASPHVAGTVALMWSAAVAIERDITATRALLDETAIDTSDLTCGGTAEDNNVWGEGKLDTFAAVERAPRGPTGTLTGTVTASSSGKPIAGAIIQAVGPATRTTTTNASGQYSLVLPVGAYDVTASAFGHLTETATGVVITDGATTVQDFALDPAPSHPVSGHVRDADGQGIEGATVTILGTPIPPATTDATGFYSFASVPEGTYDIRADAGRCNETDTQKVTVSGPTTVDFTLPLRSDAYGYFCQHETPAYHEAADPLPLFGDDSLVQITLPFPFTFYGQTHTTAFVCTNGYVTFLAGRFCEFSNSGIPSAFEPNGAVYSYWDNLFVDGAARMGTELLGTAPNRRFVIEWRNVHHYADESRRIDVELVLFENGQILHQYRHIDDDGRERGNSATLGLENQAGDVAFQHSLNEAVLNAGETAIRYLLPPSGFVQGTVTDANDDDDLALAGANIRALQGGVVVRQTTTDAAGFYRMQLPVGDYTVEASKQNYVTDSRPVAIAEDETVTANFALRSARAEVTPTPLEFVVPPGKIRTKTLRLSNTGTVDMTWEIRESGGGTATGQIEWLMRSETAVTVQNNATGSGNAFPSAARWIPDADAPLQPRILVYADDAYHTAPNTYIDQALRRLGLPYTAYYDANFAGFESALGSGGPWDVVIFGNDNYFPPPTTLTALNSYVTGGGRLVANSWTVSFNPSALWTTLGLRWIADDYDPPDPVHWWQADHPVFTDPEGVPEFLELSGFRYGIYGQRGDPLATFEALAGYTDALAPGQARMVLGNDNRTIFKGFMDGQNDADRDADGVRDGVELWMNLIVGIEQGFFSDVPWLSESPTSGTLAPGASQDIQVTVDATGLKTGVYRARLTIRSDSGRRPSLAVPALLVVPTYYQAVNAGNGPYTDLDGDTWSADQAYSAGSWGYLNSTSRPATTQRPIFGTDDDLLYQSARQDPTEYRFDGLPPGVYEVDLRFAEAQGGRPGGGLHDVIIEGVLVLPAHDIAGEVGTFAADDHVFFMPVTDGQLNIRLVRRLGMQVPIISGIQVTHRPDR